MAIKQAAQIAAYQNSDLMRMRDYLERGLLLGTKKQRPNSVSFFREYDVKIAACKCNIEIKSNNIKYICTTSNGKDQHVLDACCL